MLLDRIVQWFLPRDNRFFVYLQSIAGCLREGAEVFFELRDAKDPSELARIATILHQKEETADKLAHVLYDELDKTFVTPIDREDLHELTSALDDVLDHMENLSADIVLYNLAQLTEPMRELVRLARDAVLAVVKSIGCLPDLSRTDEIQIHLVQVNSLENEGDQTYRRAISQLFSAAPDPVELIREKEILDGLEALIDACEDVMDVVRRVVVKNG